MKNSMRFRRELRMIHKQVTNQRGTVHYWISRPESGPGNGPESKPVDVQGDRPKDIIGAAAERCLVFTHGLTANHTMFEKQVAYFSAHCTVLVWDVPMHGESRPYRDFSYANTASDLKQILDAESIGQVVLVGMSMGGYPSQAFADRYPECVGGFVALDTTPFGLEYYSRSDRWWLRQVGPMARLIPDKMLRKSMAKSVSRTRYAYDMMMRMLNSCTKDEIVEQMAIAYSGFLKENKDVSVRFPVLILLGEFDKTGKVRQYCEMWSKQLHAPLHIIADAAHFSNADQPEAVNREIHDFLDQIGFPMQDQILHGEVTS